MKWSEKAKIMDANGGAEMLKKFRSTILLVVIAFLMAMITLLVTVRVKRITGTEVGVKVNNLTGSVSVIDQQGTQIYIGFIHNLYILDQTVQRLKMTAETDRGSRLGQDDLRIKTVDGSDVFLDLTINYRMLPDGVKEVILSSGPGDTYKVKWVRDYSRSVCRTVFGELTTEEFYNASQRDTKALKAKREMNDLLKPYGLEITSVIAEKFRFHKEYEDKIREKKLADQEVEEQISLARAALQDQNTQEVKANKLKEVAIASYKGEMDKMIVEAKANANRRIREAEAYAITTKKGADADFYQRSQNAIAILAKLKTEAEGLKQMAQALQGEGGVNLVKLNYVRRLATMVLTGQPFTVQSDTARFSHIREGAVRQGQ